MNAQELLVHDGREWQRTETFHASIVNFFRVLVFALEFEREVVGQMSAFVVSPQEEKSVRVPDLERPQVQHALDGEVTSIDIISQEQIASIGRVAAYFEKFHQVEVLAMNIATDSDRGVHFEQVWLVPQNLGRLTQNEQCLVIGQPPFAVEMVLEERDIGFGPRLVTVELLVGRFLERWGLDFFDDAFESVEGLTFVVGVNREIDRRQPQVSVPDR